MTARILFALFVLWSFWACGGDSVTTSEPPALERGLHEVGNLTQPRYQHVATLLPDGKVLIAGGYKEGIPNFTDVSNRHISAEIFDPVTGTSSPTGNMTVGRNTDHGILLPDGRILIVPRYHDFPIEVYDPHSARFNGPGENTLVSAHFDCKSAAKRQGLCNYPGAHGCLRPGCEYLSLHSRDGENANKPFGDFAEGRPRADRWRNTRGN